MMTGVTSAAVTTASMTAHIMRDAAIMAAVVGMSGIIMAAIVAAGGDTEAECRAVVTAIVRVRCRSRISAVVGSVIGVACCWVAIPIIGRSRSDIGWPNPHAKSEIDRLGLRGRRRAHSNGAAQYGRADSSLRERLHDTIPFLAWRAALWQRAVSTANITILYEPRRAALFIVHSSHDQSRGFSSF